jgi:hypothetical protein
VAARGKPEGGQLFLHVGTHKTGTTAFQLSLRANAKALAAQGFRSISQPVKKPGAKLRRKHNLAHLSHSFLRPDIATVSRLQRGLPDIDAGEEAELRAGYLARIQARKEPGLILSSEGFCFLRTPGEAALMRDFLAATGREVTVLLVIRNEADWRASWHNQVRKLPAASALNDTLPDSRRADGEWYFDIAAIRGFWEPMGDLRVIDYDAEREAEGSILPALYREIGADTRGLALDFRANPRAEIGGGD